MKLLIVFYSLYGHVLRMAHAVQEGGKSMKGVDEEWHAAEPFRWRSV
jgi:hypothetical protein